MLTGYRLLIIALGLILAAHHPNAKAAAQQPDSKQSIAESLQDIAATYDKQAKRSERPDQQAEPCQPGEDKRYSDLCAQWKAADAAADSAWWAGAATWVSGVSGLLVLVAIGLAYQANAIARQTAHRQLRAYVGVTGCSIAILEDGSGFILQVEIKNSGQTPAHNFGLMGEVYSEEISFKGSRPAPETEAGYRFPLNPGEVTYGAYRLLSPDVNLLLQAVLDGHYAIYIHGTCTYKDIFGNAHRLNYKWMFGGRMAKTGGLVMHACEDGNTAT